MTPPAALDEAREEMTTAFVAKIMWKEHTRDHVARWYAQSMREKWPVDYAAVNKAIVERWSLTALRYIKDKAWKLL